MKKLIVISAIFFAYLQTVTAQALPSGVPQNNNYEYNYFTQYLRAGKGLLIPDRPNTWVPIAPAIQYYNGNLYYYNTNLATWVRLRDTANTGGGAGGGGISTLGTAGAICLNKINDSTYAVNLTCLASTFLELGDSSLYVSVTRLQDSMAFVRGLINLKQNYSDSNTWDATRYWVQQQGYLSTIPGIQAVLNSNSQLTNPSGVDLNTNDFQFTSPGMVLGLYPSLKRFAYSGDDGVKDVSLLIDPNGFLFNVFHGGGNEYIHLNKESSWQDLLIYSETTGTLNTNNKSGGYNVQLGNGTDLFFTSLNNQINNFVYNRLYMDSLGINLGTKRSFANTYKGITIDLDHQVRFDSLLSTSDVINFKPIVADVNGNTKRTSVNYLTSSDISGKLNISDTASMLAGYVRNQRFLDSLSNHWTAIQNKQPLDADLTTIAGLTATTDNFIQSKAGAWASRTIAQVKADLGVPTITPSALTKTDDTNVTLTIGGTPGTSLLQSVSLTLGWQGLLADGRIASAANWNSKMAGTDSTYWRSDSLLTKRIGVEKLLGYVRNSRLNFELAKDSANYLQIVDSVNESLLSFHRIGLVRNGVYAGGSNSGINTTIDISNLNLVHLSQMMDSINAHSGGGSSAAPGTYGDIMLNRNGLFDDAADSLSYTTADGLVIKNKIKLPNLYDRLEFGSNDDYINNDGSMFYSATSKHNFLNGAAYTAVLNNVGLTIGRSFDDATKARLELAQNTTQYAGINFFQTGAALKTTPIHGDLEFVGDSVYATNSVGRKTLAFTSQLGGSAANIGNSNLTLTSPRTLSGAGNTLDFTNLDQFNVSSVSGNSFSHNNGSGSTGSFQTGGDGTDNFLDIFSRGTTGTDKKVGLNGFQATLDLYAKAGSDSARIIFDATDAIKFRTGANGKYQFDNIPNSLSGNDFMMVWNGVTQRLGYRTIPSGGSSTFAGLTDVSLTSLATNDFLKWDGTDWINRTPSNVKTDLSINNVENVALSTWAGSSNITTLGTIGTGTWNATIIGTNKGGTGVDNSTGGIANTFWARPNGATGAATYRAIVAADIPILNQNTTGSAGSVLNSLSISAELISGGASSYNGSAARSIAIQPTSVTNAMLAGSIDQSKITNLVIDLANKQPLNTNLTSIGGLANASGFLKNNGSGVFTYENPSGSGTVTNVSATDGGGLDFTVTNPTSTPAISAIVTGAPGSFEFSGATTFSQFTTDQNDLSLTNVSTIRVSTNSNDRKLTSITGGTQGRHLMIENVGTNDLILMSDDGSSGTSTNRFDFDGVDFIVGSKEIRTVVYDATIARWTATDFDPNITFNRRKPSYSWDYMLAGVSTANFPTTAISSGTATYVNGTDNHPGYMTTTSSTTANSGNHSYLYNLQNNLLFKGGEVYECIFQPKVASNTATTIRFGFMDATTSTDAVDGAYFEIPAGSFAVVGKTSNNSTRTTSATIATIAVNTWYRARIVVNRAASSVSFTLYDANGVSLGTQSNGSNIPTTAGREFGVGFIATNSGTTATLLNWLDYQFVQLGSGKAINR